MTNPDRSAEQARFVRADALFDAALDLDRSERIAYVTNAVAGDTRLREDVLALLRAHDRSGAFLDASSASHATRDPLQERLQAATGDNYRVQRRIAQGGMASVYLAEDTKHQRSVAIKVFAFDGESSAQAASGAERFLAEIRIMARLQHPHLLPLFDSGAANGLRYLVMPFVNGETLRQRLGRESPLPVDEALRLTHAIAGALAHAHDAGIVHRDLKPENILLRNGEPLVADFGIALASLESASRMTQSGMLIGTPQYMSPEQASGEQLIDARTDVYTLGAMLYEMLTGDPPHVASSALGVLAKVRAESPTPVHVRRESVTPALSAAIDGALAKRPADRFASVRAFDAALTEAMRHTAANTTGRNAHGSAALQSSARKLVTARSIIVGSVVVAIVIALFVGVRSVRSRNAAPTAAARFVVPPVRDAAIGSPPTLTPDGASLVYPGSASSGRQLFVRRVSELQARVVAGTEGVLSAVVSPNGQSIAYITTDDKLRRVAIDGGQATVLAGIFRYSNAAWAGNDRIVLASFSEQGLTWLSASGGPRHQLTRIDTLRHDSGHSAPLVLPDQRTVVFTILRDRSGPGPGAGELAVVTLDSTANATQSAYTPLGIVARDAVGFVDGWLLYTEVDGARVMAIRFDPVTRKLTSGAVAVLEHPGGGIDAVSVATNGTLLYSRSQTANIPALVDSTGTSTPLFAGVVGSFMNPRLSPDGKRLVVQSSTARGNDIWLYDMETHTPSHITNSGSAVGPSWSADGNHVVYFSTQNARDAIWRQAVDGASAPQQLIAAPGVFAPSESSDGRTIVFQRMLNGIWSVWYSTPAVDSLPHKLLSATTDVFMPALSPDSRWIAYAANESGRYEVYVRPFPGPGSAVQVSQNGGTEPGWALDGRRIFFRADRRMYSAAVATQTALRVTDRRVLFTDAFDGDMPMPHRNYDVTRDGRHFVMIAAAPDAAPETIVVVNWLDEFRSRIARARSAR